MELETRSWFSGVSQRKYFKYSNDHDVRVFLLIRIIKIPVPDSSTINTKLTYVLLSTGIVIDVSFVICICTSIISYTCVFLFPSLGVNTSPTILSYPIHYIMFCDLILAVGATRGGLVLMRLNKKERQREQKAEGRRNINY